MKKIIILAIALLSTGIVVSETLQKKDADLKPAMVKIQKAANSKNIANDEIATGD